jgi:16S rRNA (adenine1518-N6/adenine1519-N6)-dimethyltransferase
MAGKRLGQHFLTDAGWRARILEALHASPEDTWVEIGAGHGEMTRGLAQAVRRVIAIELDPRLLERLHALARGDPRIEVVAGDVLALDLSRLAGGRFKVYGNLPYYITSPILHRLFDCIDQIDAIAVVIQLEVATRLVAQPGRRDYSYLSVATQFYARPEILLRIPPGAFRPRPQVASALVSLRPPGERVALGIGDEARFLQFVQACFAKKRKTLGNNLRAIVPVARAHELLEEAGLRRDARAEQLRLPEFADLFSRLQS